jgi:hypothetical protein
MCKNSLSPLPTLCFRGISPIKSNRPPYVELAVLTILYSSTVVADIEDKVFNTLRIKFKIKFIFVQDEHLF